MIGCTVALRLPPPPPLLPYFPSPKISHLPRRVRSISIPTISRNPTYTSLFTALSISVSRPMVIPRLHPTLHGTGPSYAPYIGAVGSTLANGLKRMFLLVLPSVQLAEYYTSRSCASLWPGTCTNIPTHPALLMTCPRAPREGFQA